MTGSKLYLKEALGIFPEVDPQLLLLQKTQELVQTETVIHKFASLYASTVQCMWNDKRYHDAIELDAMWNDSPLHAEYKQVKLYVYELQSVLGHNDRLSPVDIERARRIPLARVLGRKGPFKCPFHRDSTPSFHIKQHYYTCFGCGEKGDNIKFVMKTKNLDFRNAVTYLLEHE